MSKIDTLIVKEHIKEFKFDKVSDRTTICTITTIFDMDVIGYSHVQNIDDHNSEIGEKTAYNNAFSKLFPLVVAYQRGYEKGLKNE